MVPRDGPDNHELHEQSEGTKQGKKNVAAVEKQLESMGYRLKQERGRWPFLSPRLESAMDKT